MLLLRGLVRDVFLKPAQEQRTNQKTGEIINASAATNYAVIEHHNINRDGVSVLELVNVKLVDQEAAFRACIGKEIVIPCGHGLMNGKTWYNVPKGHLPTVQQAKAV